ncbi:Cytochrome c-type biogenesis protein CcmC [Acididesulfobacillus acetoxydans]|uniref:Heme exporter protein C n=1 Tax=Acididesulfobacillus acetoxydans TaxID=1561005 RepID=A0A8S0W752_9FIRM|nr:c-type cytochrome biogenesis protein CcsB [Acididesulfobacillus acetoxydans]CAA7600379.1 Cytochrome c-type biogenesis protein CcmC [Acididesulfobacillus acetoxydans]CEJ07901.1 Cytochrome c biogenesis protein CcsA [Acididesulfobacillus acetoxydans]
MSQILKGFEGPLFYLLLAAYVLATLLYWGGALGKKNGLSRAATWVTVAGLVINTVTVGVRMLIAHRPPLANGYEFILTFCWGIVAVYLFAEFRYRLRALGSFVLPVPALLLLFVEIAISPAERSSTAIMPALKSQWLTIHVATAMLAYGAFAVSFGLGVMYLLKERKIRVTGRVGGPVPGAPGDAERETMSAAESSATGSLLAGSELSNGADEVNGGVLARFPALEVLDELAYKVVAFGFPLLTLCIITGAVWANYTWGTYWSWDPKETWSLITWLVYAGYLHVRFTRGWKGRPAAWLAVLGFAAVLFTFFGVNYFLPGLHSYANPGG